MFHSTAVHFDYTKMFPNSNQEMSKLQAETGLSV